MKTVLIVEDEKMIRQGLKAMIMRSGVPIEMILECSNGQMALDILKNEHVDVMFTDIRMPKMSGLELVREIQKLEDKPEIVAVSGYDDFNYAVDMLRGGVREYILKPVEREKIVEILKKLDQEISEREAKLDMEFRIGQTQLKHLITGEVSEDERQLLVDRYDAAFFTMVTSLRG